MNKIPYDQEGPSIKALGGPVNKLNILFKQTQQRLSNYADIGRKTENLGVGLMFEQIQPAVDTHWYYWPTAGPFPRGPLTTLWPLQTPEQFKGWCCVEGAAHIMRWE